MKKNLSCQPRKFKLLILAFCLALRGAMAFNPEITLHFEQNKGQFGVDSDVKYYLKSRNFTVLFEEDGLSYIYNNQAKSGTEVQQIDLTFSHQSAMCSLRAESTNAVSHYYNLAEKTRKTTAHFDRITYHNIYPAIDLRYFITDDNKLKYEYVVHPGGKVSDICIKYNGLSKALRTNTQGQLELAGDMGLVYEDQPYCYTSTGKEIAGSYRCAGNELGFDLESYLPDETIIIDPYIMWSTFLGGTKADEARTIAIDTANNLYVTGVTESSPFPIKNTVLNTSYGGGKDVFVSKFSKNGQLVWSGYFGGTAADEAVKMTCGPDNNLYLLLNTKSNNLGNVNNVLNNNNSGDDDLYLLKLDSLGNIIWSGYYGGSKTDVGTCIKKGADNLMYVCGYTTSSDLITDTNAFQTKLMGDTDAFVFAIDTNGWVSRRSYFGGDKSDVALAVTANWHGDYVITGWTNSTDLPVPANVWLKDSLTGKTDAFVAKFNKQAQYRWCAYVGGEKNDTARVIQLDYKGSFIIAGNSNSNKLDVIVKDTVQDKYAGGPCDAFIYGFDYRGRQQFFTYYGGNGYENITSIDWYHTAGLLTGYSNSSDLTMIHHNFRKHILQPQSKGKMEGFFLNIDSSGRIITSSYLGGTGNDRILEGKFYYGGQVFAGSSHSSSLYTGLTSYQANNNGKGDMFLTALCPDVFKNIIFGKCTEDSAISSVTADCFAFNRKVHYRWQSRTLFGWKDIPGEDNYFLNQQIIHQKTQFRRIYKMGFCQDTSNTTEFILGPVPKSFFDYKSKKCITDTFYFTNKSTVSYGSLRFEWKFERQTKSFVENPKYVFSHPDTFNLARLKVISDSNCVDVFRRNIFVGGIPQPQFNYDILCDKEEIALTNTTKNIRNPHAVWYFENGDSMLGNFITYPMKMKGKTRVKMLAYSFRGCEDTTSLLIDLEHPLTVNFNTNNNCINQAIELQKHLNYKSPARKITWNFDNGDTSHSLVTNYQYSKAGTYNITLSITDRNGCIDTDTQAIEIFELPKSKITYTKPCTSEVFNFKLQTTQNNPHYHYTWQFGDGKSRKFSNGSAAFLKNSFNHRYSNFDSFTVQLISAVDSNQCADTQSIKVLNDTLVHVNFSAEQFCEYETCMFNNKSTGKKGGIAWWWHFGDNNKQKGQSAGHKYTPGSYNITLIAQSKKGCSDSLSKQITIYKKPDFSFESDSVCFGDEMTFTPNYNTYNDTLDTIYWTFGDGSKQTATKVSHQYSNPGYYSASAILETKHHCTETFNLRVFQPDSLRPIIVDKINLNCFGDKNGLISLIVNGGTGSKEVLWQTKPQVKGYSLKNLGAGSYTALISDEMGCSKTITRKIKGPDSLIIRHLTDVSICRGDEYGLNLNAQGGNKPYIFTLECNKPHCNIIKIKDDSYILKPKYKTEYTVKAIDDKGCQSAGNSFKVWPKTPLKVSINPDSLTTITNDYFELEALSDSASNYSWSPAYIFTDPDKSKTGGRSENNFTATVTVSSPDHCDAKAAIEIKVVSLEIPTAFTPNNDGTNDTWVIKNLELLYNSKVSIYNRWGGLIFSTENNSEQWDGSYNGSPVPPASYYFVIEADGISTGITGHVTILE
ncbi:T9SS type B sorting domain-containing protein [bacterium]|nr:T9SS type B sorting domain-containing protein [bacterium]